MIYENFSFKKDLVLKGINSYFTLVHCEKVASVGNCDNSKSNDPVEKFLIFIPIIFKFSSQTETVLAGVYRKLHFQIWGYLKLKFLLKYQIRFFF
jgi:hypothetical protein